VPVEWSGQDDAREDPLTVLGSVPEPRPGVLDAARERLWSLMAAEMLALKADQMNRDVAGRDPASLSDQDRYHLRASADRPPHSRRRTNGGTQ
jgi:hypothetical protein